MSKYLICLSRATPGRALPEEILLIPTGRVDYTKDGKVGSFFLSPESGQRIIAEFNEWVHYLGESIDLKSSSFGIILNKLEDRLKSDDVFAKRMQKYLLDVSKRKSKYEKTVLDIFGAISRNRIGGGHPDGYWSWENRREQEVFAQMTVLYGRQAKEWKELQDLIPELGKNYQEIISKASATMN